MKIYLTTSLLALLMLTSCYTRFSAPEREDDYTVRRPARERVYHQSEKHNDTAIQDEDAYAPGYDYEDGFDVENDAEGDVYVTECDIDIYPVVRAYRYQVYTPWYRSPVYRPWHRYSHHHWWAAAPVYYDVYGYYDPYDFWYTDPWYDWYEGYLYPGVVVIGGPVIINPWYPGWGSIYDPWYPPYYGGGYYTTTVTHERKKRDFDTGRPVRRPRPGHSTVDNRDLPPSALPVASRPTARPVTRPAKNRPERLKPVSARPVRDDDQPRITTPQRKPLERKEARFVNDRKRKTIKSGRKSERTYYNLSKRVPRTDRTVRTKTKKSSRLEARTTSKKVSRAVTKQRTKISGHARQKEQYEHRSTKRKTERSYTPPAQNNSRRSGYKPSSSRSRSSYTPRSSSGSHRSSSRSYSGSSKRRSR